MNRTLLLVDDETDLLDIYTFLLSRAGFRVLAAGGAKEALELVKREHVDVVVSDYRMPGASGLDLCRTLRQEGSLVGFILISGNSNVDELEWRRAGAQGFLTKPLDIEALVALASSHSLGA